MPEARKAMEETLKAIAFPAGYSYTFEGSAIRATTTRRCSR